MRIIILDKTRIGDEHILNQKIKDKTVLENFVELGKKINCNSIVISTKFPEKFKGYKTGRDIQKGEDDIILDDNRIYDSDILKKTRNADKSILFMIKDKKDLEKAREWIDYSEKKNSHDLGKYINVKYGKKIGTLLAKIGVTPNQTSLLMLLTGITSAMFFTMPNYLANLTGGLIIHLTFMLDVADGQIARIKNQSTKFGKIFDGVLDQVYMNMWYIAIGIGLFYKYNSIIFVLLSSAIPFGNVISFTFHQLSNEKRDNNKTEGKTAYLGKWDIRFYMITLFAILGKLEILLILYAIYHNLWIYSLAAYYLQEKKIKY